MNATWIRLSMLAGVLMAVASAAGLLFPQVYARETPSWAAQSVGQDVVNLVCAAPLLFLSAWVAQSGSIRGMLVWMGGLLYVAYSYVLYAFFVHFGPTFPIYVAVLGASLYALIGGVLSTDREALRGSFPPDFRSRTASAFLIAIGVLFSIAWLSSIARALASGTAPAEVSELGLAVNPVHVLDLAFLLPLAITVGVAHWKRKSIGLLLVVPLLVFFMLMGAAIIVMPFVMRARGVATTLSMVPAMAVCVVMSGVLALRVLQRVLPGAVAH